MSTSEISARVQQVVGDVKARIGELDQTIATAQEERRELTRFVRAIGALDASRAVIKSPAKRKGNTRVGTPAITTAVQELLKITEKDPEQRITVGTLAQLTGYSRVSTDTVLKELRRSGAIRRVEDTGRAHAFVVDREALLRLNAQSDLEHQRNAQSRK